MIVDALPQPLLLTAVAPPELLLAPELELPLAPESPVEADPPLEPESIEIPELDVEPPPEAPELDPVPPLALPELDALPEEEIAPSLPGELSLVEWLPHALVIAARHARHPVNAEWRRAHPVTLSTLIGSLTAAKFRKIPRSSYRRRSWRRETGPAYPAVASGSPIRHVEKGRTRRT